MNIKLKQSDYIKFHDEMIAEESMPSLLRICDFITSNFLNKAKDTDILTGDLILGNTEIIKLKELGVSMLGIIYYAMHYLEQIKFYQTCLAKCDFKLRSGKITRKGRVGIEKKTDEIEELFFRSKDVLSSVLADINIFIPMLESLLKKSLSNDTFSFYNIIPVSKKFSDYYLKLIENDQNRTSLLCLGLRLDRRKSFKGIYNYLSWFGDEKAYLSKLYLDILCFFILPVLLGSGASKVSLSKLSNAFIEIFDFMGLDISIVSVSNPNSDMNLALSLVLRYFMQQQERGLFVSNYSDLDNNFYKISLKTLFSNFSSFDKIISDYCSGRLFANNNILEFYQFVENISNNKSKLSEKINNIFTKHNLFI